MGVPARSFCLLSVCCLPIWSVSPASWQLCPGHSTGTLKNYLADSCAHGRPKKVAVRDNGKQRRKLKRANWFFFFFSVKFLSSGFLPLLFKIMQLCQIRWVHCLLGAKNRSWNSLCGPGVVRESKPDAQIKSASCPEQWLPEATEWFIWSSSCSSQSFDAQASLRPSPNACSLPRRSHSAFWLGKRAVFFSLCSWHLKTILPFSDFSFWDLLISSLDLGWSLHDAEAVLP